MEGLLQRVCVLQFLPRILVWDGPAVLKDVEPP